MNNWKLTIDVSDLWKQEEGKELDVNVFKEILYNRLSYHTQKINSWSLDATNGYEDLLIFLHNSEFEDFDEFDYWLSDFYDFCDQYRIWFKTF